jgi:hypothetical protein
VRCKTCNRANLPNQPICIYCGEEVGASKTPDHGLRFPDRSPKASAPTSSSLPDITTREGVDGRRIKKVFKWALCGWTAFFILGWFINHDLQYLVEIVGSVGFGVAAALVSTLIYWGIREFIKSNADKDHRADAADSEIAELRRKVDELSRKSED